ncbi:4436_t:CDS:2, partial [Acaulospora colombiana]
MALEGDELFEMGSKNPKASVDVVQGGRVLLPAQMAEELTEAITKRDTSLPFSFARWSHMSRQFRMVPQTVIEDLSGSRAPDSSAQKRRSNAGKRGKKRARTVQSDEDEEMLDNYAERPTSRRKLRRIGSASHRRDEQDDIEVEEESDKDSTYLPEPVEGSHPITNDAHIA